MNYRECLDYLDRLGNEVLTMKFGLETMRLLLGRLGDPQLRYPSILVAGTNGKGSVARFLAAILSASGYRTGLYTSPHLVHVEERIAVDGRTIARDRFAAAFSRVSEAILSLGPPRHATYFETLTATAFAAFSEAEIDIAVLEIGMGGRLDSTNVVDPEVSVLTPIGLDHQHILGATVAEIAAEKAGIIHPGRPVVSAPQVPDAMRVVRARAEDLGSPLEVVDPSEIASQPTSDGRHRLAYRGRSARLRVFGRHQAENAALAILASDTLQSRGWILPKRSVEKGLSGVQPYAAPRRLRRDPDLFIDGGHNPDAARRLASFLLEHTQPPRALVLGMMRDKEIGEFVAVLRPAFETIYLTRIESERAATVEDLLGLVPDGRAEPDPLRAVQLASADARTVVVAGSFYLAGQVAARVEVGG